MTPNDQTPQISLHRPIKVDGAYFVVAINAKRSDGNSRSIDVGVGLFCM